MRHGNFDVEAGASSNWRILNHLWPYLAESRRRVFAALFCLLLAKGAILTIPFLLKFLVDSMEGQALKNIAPMALAGLVLAYGGARFSNVFFGELRDTIFGRVTERAMRRIGLQVFRHVHALDLDFHLNRRTGGLARDIERGDPKACSRANSSGILKAHLPEPIKTTPGWLKRLIGVFYSWTRLTLWIVVFKLN